DRPTLRAGFYALRVQFQQHGLKKTDNVERQFSIGRNDPERAEPISRAGLLWKILERLFVDHGRQAGLIADNAGIPAGAPDENFGNGSGFLLR
ncbi:MAG: hypothetical protein MI806_04880, partial [Minwuiales bacterium]|nr:hypothetical protein [Minwuiales bacterium]